MDSCTMNSADSVKLKVHNMEQAFSLKDSYVYQWAISKEDGELQWRFSSLLLTWLGKSLTETLRAFLSW